MKSISLSTALIVLLACLLCNATRAFTPPVNPAEVFKVTPEMQAFFKPRVNASAPLEERARQLIDAILDADQLNFHYQWDGLSDAQTTFNTRQGNCVSFCVLFMAMSDYFGIPVRAQSVQLHSLRWENMGAYVVEISHMNLRFSASHEKAYIIDFMNIIGSRYFPGKTRILDRNEVLSIFYSNYAVQQHSLGLPAEQWFIKSLQLARTPTALSNMGIYHLQLKQYAEADLLFREASKIQKDARILALRANTARRLGNRLEADSLDKETLKYKYKNPFYHYSMAQKAAERGDWPAAEAAINEAIKRKETKAFLELRLVVQKALHQTTKATERSLARFNAEEAKELQSLRVASM